MANRSIRYLGLAVLVIVGFHAGVGFLNYLVDPLWFFGGNKLQDRNFPFDERTARAAHFLASDKDFDCYIFGASRVAMMNHHRFKGHDCFMVSFANGTPEELLAYASYIKERSSRKPELVIVGLDDFAFLSPTLESNLPAPVANGNNLYFWQYYFSGDVARWSLQTLLDITPKPRYYGRDLTGQIHDDARSMGILEGGSATATTLNPEIIEQYAEFRRMFPEARLVAYATPVEAQTITEYHDAGILHVYIEGLAKAARHFDVMYDFSIPSEITTNPELTYDGSHYEPKVNDRIVAAIQSGQPDFGIRISGLTVHDIAARYAERLRHYVK